MYARQCILIKFFTRNMNLNTTFNISLYIFQFDVHCLVRVDNMKYDWQGRKALFCIHYWKCHDIIYPYPFDTFLPHHFYLPNLINLQIFLIILTYKYVSVVQVLRFKCNFIRSRARSLVSPKYISWRWFDAVVHMDIRRRIGMMVLSTLAMTAVAASDIATEGPDNKTILYQNRRKTDRIISKNKTCRTGLPSTKELEGTGKVKVMKYRWL